MHTHALHRPRPIRAVGALLVPLVAAPAPAAEDPIVPAPFTNIRFEGGFWQPRLDTNRAVTVRYDFDQCEQTGRLDNFRVAGGRKKGGFQGIYFNDSDVFKVIEGAAYSLRTQPDPELEAYLDRLVSDIAAAQEADGYLYTARTIGDPEYNFPGRDKRWSKLDHGHELYNVGHLYEAAVAHFQATGKRALLEVAIKNADLVCRTFGPGDGQIVDVPGHQEIELGLVKLHRATGDAKYLAQARFFLDMRGRKDLRNLHGAYSQDHVPVVDQTEAVGHAVRANYMYAGMTDIAAITGDAGYTRAVDALWNNVVSRKLYLTGGVGASRHGEAYGADYELPNATAYNETCAAIALGLWAHRMFNLHGDAQYLDVLERVLHNGFLSGVSMRGDTFFYPNPLAFDGRTKFNQGRNTRAPWFGCSCCPVNVVRFIPSIPGFAYASRDAELLVNLYAPSRAEIQVGDHAVEVEQRTDYPWDGTVHLKIRQAEVGRVFSLKLRIPGWARGRPVPSDLYRYLGDAAPEVTVEVNRARVNAPLEKGFATIRRAWQPGDEVTLRLPMPVRRVASHHRVEANRGRIAIERGPLVYCLEAVDHEGRIDDLFLPTHATFTTTRPAGLLGGVVVVEANGARAQRGDNGEVRSVPATLRAVPYYAWAHRGTGQMAVWLPTGESLARPRPRPTIASAATPSASHVWHLDSIEAINDQTLPADSGDHSLPRFTWWDKRGSTQWLQYDFREPTRVTESRVYWFDDTGAGQCRVPASYRIVFRDGGEWKPVKPTRPLAVRPDQFNTAVFEPVTTTALRIEAVLKPTFSGGVLEWEIAGPKP